jgi:predicted HTH transcriptional regulator
VLYEIVATFVRSRAVGLDKESIVVRCWKEHYNPMIHDSRIYTAMRRIRELTRDELIINSGRLYRLNPRVTWGRAFKSASANRSIERYQSVLDFVRSNGSITRQVIEQSLGLASTQAKKEIQTMLDQGLLVRMNQGPATRYRLRV